ncbi:MAG: hypothetical protein ACREDR_13865, partial [Blastocatellia bacterium]
KYVAHIGQTMTFAAIAFDFGERPVQGAGLSWTSSDPEKVQVNSTGGAEFKSPGQAWIVASAGPVQERVPVLVLEGQRKRQTDEEWDSDQAKLNRDGTLPAKTGIASALLPSLMDKLSPSVYAQTGGGDSADFPYDELWSDPRNLVGHPGGRITESTNIGTVMPEGSNFNVGIPIIQVGGRGKIPLKFSLYYNSRVWSRHGNAITFNAINTWPAVGFTLSFGRIVSYGSDPNTKLVFIDIDGTRRYLGSGISTQTGTYTAKDGSDITFVGSVVSGGKIYHNNGVSETVSVVNNRLLVTSVADTNGNSYSISYFSQPPATCSNGGYQWHQAIQFISDTMGRLYEFNYDSCNNLVSITGPGLGGTVQNPVTVTVAQFDYQDASSISTSFSGLTVENVPSSNTVELKHVYFPATSTGYLITYSAYGMAYEVSKRVSMSLNGNGTISDGTEAAHALFNYPTTASSLTDAPAFTNRTESPGNPSGYTYQQVAANTFGPNTLTIAVIPPNWTNHLSEYPLTYYTRSTDSTSITNGLVTRVDVYDGHSNTMNIGLYYYASDSAGITRIQSTAQLDNNLTPTFNDFVYDAYGNITQSQEYGYQVNGSWVPWRRKVRSYLTDPNYLNAYMRSLLVEEDVYDMRQGANGTLMEKTTHAYDDYALMGNMENYGGNFGGATAVPGYDGNYNNQSLTLRGNETSETLYSNVSTPTSTTYGRKIDIFGNIVQEQVSCCNLNTYLFSSDNYWTQPDQEIKGDANGIHLTMLLAHDFNTSGQTSETNPNNLTTSYSYDASGRQVAMTNPTGSTHSMTFNDSSHSTTETSTYTSNGSAKHP